MNEIGRYAVTTSRISIREIDAAVSGCFEGPVEITPDLLIGLDIRFDDNVVGSIITAEYEGRAIKWTGTLTPEVAEKIKQEMLLPDWQMPRASFVTKPISFKPYRTPNL